MSEMEKQDILELPSKTSAQMHNTDGMLGFNETDGGFQVTLENLAQYIAGDAKEFIPPTHGTAGQLLRSTGDGGSEWGDAASPEEIAEAVTDWLDENVPTGETLVVDESLTIEGAAAEAKVTGEKIEAAEGAIKDLRKEMFSAPIEYSGITTDSSWSTGSGVDSQTGGNMSDSDYCRTGFIKIESTTCIHLDSETYDFNVWEYTSNSTGSAIFAPKKAYNDKDAFVTFDQNATYFRIGARRKDLAHIQASDITALTGAIKTYVITDPTLSIAGASADAKVVGDEIGNVKDVLNDISEVHESSNYFDHANAELTSLMSTPVLVSPKITVNAGDTFYLSYHLSSPTNLAATPFFTIRYYDSNGTLTGNAGYWVQGVTIPSGTVEVQFIVAQTTAQYIMVAKGAVATTFEEYFESYVSANDLVAREDIQELQDTAIKVEEAFVLTDKFYGVANHEMNLYYENAVQYGSLQTFAKCDISGVLAGTERFRDRLIWKPTASGTTAETVSLYKSNIKEPTLSKEVNFIAAPENAGSGTKKVIVIGDSKVAYGQPTGYLQDLFQNDSITLELVGTRWGNNSTDDDTTNRHEGRAAWGAYTYCMSESGSGGTVINPFYDSAYTDPVYHTHFNFSKYMTDQGYSDIDYVIINLGTNDFGNTTYIYRSMISAMIKSIHAYDTNIKVIVGLFEGVYVPKLEWATRNESFMEFRKAVIADHSAETNVYLNPQYLSMSLYDDYAYTEVPLSYADEFVNNGKKRKYVADGIHQNPAGFYKNAVSMYAIIKCIEAGMV